MQAMITMSNEPTETLHVMTGDEQVMRMLMNSSQNTALGLIQWDNLAKLSFLPPHTSEFPREVAVLEIEERWPWSLRRVLASMQRLSDGRNFKVTNVRYRPAFYDLFFIGQYRNLTALRLG
jgi:hypothetical protein